MAKDGAAKQIRSFNTRRLLLLLAPSNALRGSPAATRQFCGNAMPRHGDYSCIERQKEAKDWLS
jgi:hypothetical protein